MKSQPIRLPVWAQFGILLFAYIVFSFLGESMIAPLFDRVLPRIDESIVIGDSIANLLVGFGLLLLYRLLSGRSPWTFFQKTTRWPQFVLGCLVGVGFVSLIVFILYLKGDLLFAGLKVTPYIPVYILFFLTVSWVEEVLTRGVLQHVLAPKSNLIAIGLISVLFGLLHLGNPGHTALAIPNTILVGVSLGLATHQTSSLRYTLGFHFTWNASLAVLYGMTVSGISFEHSLIQTVVRATPESGGTYGIEGGYLVTILFSLVVLYQLYLLRRKHDQETSRI